MVLTLNIRQHKKEQRHAWQVYKIGQARPALKQYPMMDIAILLFIFNVGLGRHSLLQHLPSADQ